MEEAGNRGKNRWRIREGGWMSSREEKGEEEGGRRKRK